MTDMQRMKQQAVAAKLAADEMKHAEGISKAKLLEWCEETGVTGFELLDDDGFQLAAFSKIRGKVVAVVTDEAAFTAWMEKTYPSEVITVVRPAARERFLKDAADAGEPVNIATGEVIPGVEIRVGDPHIQTRPTPHARQVMKDLLAGSPLLELAGGESGA